MKRVFLLFLAMTLILMPESTLVEPKVKKSEEPNIASVVPSMRMENPTAYHESIIISLPTETSSVEAKEEKSKTQVSTARTMAPTSKPKAKALPKAVEPVNKEPEGDKRTFTLTAYTAGYESTGKRKGDKNYGVTASGTIVEEGRTIACPKTYPLGTKIYIPSLGNVYTCEDRGSKVKNDVLDIYIESLDVALEFGRKKGVVGYVLTES